MSSETGPRGVGRLLVTGASGFVGKHVRESVSSGQFGEATFIAPTDQWDIRDPSAVESFVATERPESVLHLAAQGFVPRSFDDPRDTFTINFMGTLNILLALKRAKFKGRMIYVSSGDVYGHVPETELPINEESVTSPFSPYAVSKLAAEQLCLQWHRSELLDVVIVRPFNHIGPGQDKRFVAPALARQVVAIARGTQPPIIEAGDLDTTRDFTDVRDVVAAYSAIFSAGIGGRTYVLASGKERKIRELLTIMCERMRVNPVVKRDPARMRHGEQRRMVASSARLAEDTNWQPRYSLEQTVCDILEDAGQAHG